MTNRHLLMQAGNAITMNVIKLIGHSLINLFKTTGGKEMSGWMKFEEDCFNYLQKKYGSSAKFIALGKADSTKPDICVETNKGKFYIEVKEAKAQCCQFVLFPNNENKSFDLSKESKCPQSSNCNFIISHMNNNYAKFAKVGTNGIPIKVNKNILYGLVSEFYKAKNVEYFITKQDDYIVIPIEKFSDYFDITANYRKKGSGSTEPTKNANNTAIIQGLEDKSIDGSIEYVSVGGKTRCFLHSSCDLHTKRMMREKHIYQFKENAYSKQVSRKSQNVYEVRRLSNTSNPNVICQISLKKYIQETCDLLAFKHDLT